MFIRIFILSVVFFFFNLPVSAQDTTQKIPTQELFDSTGNVNLTDSTTVIAAINDSVPERKKHSPRKATFRSAVIPGWGQAYNREYWKIPLVYGVLAIPAVAYIYNNKWYKRTRDAYNIRVNNDTDNFSKIDPKLVGLNAQSLQLYRNQFRKDKDYSVLYFLIAWGINVIDATVFGHLKDFDVSDELGLQIKPSFDASSKKPGIALVFNVKSPGHKLLPVR
jgi:hypothetical protein